MNFQTKSLQRSRNKVAHLRITAHGYVLETPPGVTVTITDERPECRDNTAIGIKRTTR